MRSLFILNKSEHYRSDDPKWRSIGYCKDTLVRPWCLYLENAYELVDDPRIRIPLLRKLDE